MDAPLPVAVIGGGITGLTAAWHLKRAGVPVVVFEASGRAGGVIAAARDRGWLHDQGPNSLLENSPAISSFIAELGLGPRRLYADRAAKKRYVVNRGRLVAMPGSPLQFALTRLFSWRAKAFLLGEPFRPRFAGTGDESVAQFARRRLGREFLDYAVDPFVGGVYAGDPERLSLRHGFPKLHALEAEHGSLIRGALRRRNASGGPAGRILSFPDGLEELPLTIASALGESLRLRTPVIRIRRAPASWEVHSGEPGAFSSQVFRAVICALPADALAAVSFEGVPGAERIADLKEIEQPPVASIFTGYRREDIAHPLDGFGLLMPGVENRRILGTLFSSTLFPDRAPAGHVALTTFVGGIRRPGIALLEESELLGVVQAELGGLLGIRKAPVFVNVRRWPRAIPQYNLGFERFEAICAGAEANAPGLHIGGNCRDGISLSYCLSSGRRLADVVLAPTHVRSPPY